MRYARLHFVVEGQTEETFVNRVLCPHLASHAVGAYAQLVETRRRHGAIFRGGLTSYAKARRHLIRWMKQDQNRDAFFTTMFDLYALPPDFPGTADTAKERDPYRRVAILEDALQRDISDRRFIPYLQLHEFEALLFADLQKLDGEFLEYDAAIQELIKVASDFASPELIDDGCDTAPSKRLIAVIPEYEGRKASAGPLVAEKIGLETLRTRCGHFGAWLARLEGLSTGPIA